ncbi:GntR family transcriptional regulator [Lachnospiraceae bacterium 42-17]|nr:GntR family transcriptional regulator [Dorea sp.]
MITHIEEQKNKYSQLYNTFYSKITSGEWENGHRIEPERELCQLYNVSRITVRETLRLLEQEGLIVRQQGRGTYVRRKPIEQKLNKLYSLREHFKKEGVENIAEIRSFERISANLFLSRALNIKLTDDVIKIVRVFYAAGTPYVLETNYLPAAYFRDITEKMVEMQGLYNSFSTLGISISKAVEQIKPILIDKSTAGILQVRTNDAAMFIDRTTYSQDVVIEFSRSIVRSDYFIYTVELS